MSTSIITNTAILPDSFVDAVVIDRASAAPAKGNFDRGACPCCGHVCPDGESGRTWVHIINYINDTKKERRYHFHCLLKEVTLREMRNITEGAPTKVGDGHTYQVTFKPAKGFDNKELAAAAMTPNRLAGIVSETSGQWYRLEDGMGYVSPKMRNLKWQGKLDTMSKLCQNATVYVDIFLDGKYAETVRWHWSNRDERKRFVSEVTDKKSPFLVMLDWEVGKYRKHGLQQYNYPENIERAKAERDYGVKGRKRFWL